MVLGKKKNRIKWENLVGEQRCKEREKVDEELGEEPKGGTDLRWLAMKQ